MFFVYKICQLVCNLHYSLYYNKSIFKNPWAYFLVFSPNRSPWAFNMVGLFLGKSNISATRYQVHNYKRIKPTINNIKFTQLGALCTFHMQITDPLFFDYLFVLSQLFRGGSRIWLRGSPEFFWPIFANSTQRSHANEVSPYWPGSNMHSLHF